MMADAYSTECERSTLEIIRPVLRDAATADTYQSALGATGAALVAISALVRAEVGHA